MKILSSCQAWVTTGRPGERILTSGPSDICRLRNPNPPILAKSPKTFALNPLPSLARPSLLHRLDRKDSKIFVHPLETRLDVCNGHTRCLSECHLRWWTNANEPRRISKTLHKSDAAPRLEQHIDVTRSIVGDESLTCRQHMICAQGRVFNRACSRCTQEDRRCDRVPCQQKHRFLPDTHTPNPFSSSSLQAR